MCSGSQDAESRANLRGAITLKGRLELRAVQADDLPIFFTQQQDPAALQMAAWFFNCADNG